MDENNIDYSNYPIFGGKGQLSELSVF